MSEHQKADFTLPTTEDYCRLFKGLIYSNIYSAQVQFMLLGTAVTAKVKSTAGGEYKGQSQVLSLGF